MLCFRGAGNNIAQDIIDALQQPVHTMTGKIEAFRSYADNPRNTLSIQAGINKHFHQQTAPLVSPLRFNGFFFGMNVSALHALAFRAGRHMLLPQYANYYSLTSEQILDSAQYYELLDAEEVPMVGQEAWLVQRMVKACLELKIRWTNTTHWDEHGNAHGKYHQLSATQKAALKLPLPKLALGAFVYHFKSVTIMKGLLQRRAEITSMTGQHNPCAIRSAEGVDIRGDFHMYHLTEPSHIKNEGDNNTLPWLAALRDQSASSLLTHPVLYTPKVDIANTLTIGMVVSNPETNPAAGDLMTAAELATALEQIYAERIRILYLHQGRDWYDPELLAQADVLIAYLDTWDAGRALTAHAPRVSSRKYAQLPTIGVKPNAVLIGWARNWFHRWIGRPWAGHFDMLLVSSHTALRVLTSISDSIGLPTKCVQNCPDVGVPLPTGKARSHSGFRRHVPIRLLLLASNLTSFRCPAVDLSKDNTSRTTDYLIPMSYHKQARRIMSLRPDLLAPYRGKVLGSHWDQAPRTSNTTGDTELNSITEDFFKMWAGASPYRSLPSAYSESLVILDDANHATEAWGSVNSRVYDGLACGRLVITNGLKGSQQVFSGVLPYWERNGNATTSSYTLRELLQQYIDPTGKPTNIYHSTQIALEESVRKHHSYLSRARSLGDYLGELGVELTASHISASKAQPNSLALAQPPQVCMGIRTMPAQYPTLRIMLTSLLLQHAQMATRQAAGKGENHSDSNFSSHPSALDLHLIVVETQEHTRARRIELQDIIDDISAAHGGEGRGLHLLYDPLGEQLAYERASEKCSPLGLPNDAALNRAPNALYGYEETDLLLSYMLERWRARKQTDRRDALRCDWIMFSNGDNLFSAAWLATIAEAITGIAPESKSAINDQKGNNGLQIVAWDFVSHHPRITSEGLQPNQVIRVDLSRRGYVDLSSFVTAASLVEGADASFLKDAPFTADIFARDFFFVKQLYAELQKQCDQKLNSSIKDLHSKCTNTIDEGIRYLHQVLLLHQ